ncbi:uncharacterized protein LOC114362941 [Ostrinia furnacalis]|uniref:uncharacterized protein LOC114362941 n=1 Tax=Ostrinia furnacalis TaxID=93504 RepID=UPI001039BAEA|nr:uncharacterized protein LOC114362941 [Ostrinia furnacalis]
MSSRGALMISLDGFKFLKHTVSKGGLKTRWWCGTHNHRGCRAVVYTVADKAYPNQTFLSDRPTFFTSKIGARLMQLRGYHYTRRSVCSSKVRWLCTESRDRNCHAVVVTIGRTIIDRHNKHNHPPK